MISCLRNFDFSHLQSSKNNIADLLGGLRHGTVAYEQARAKKGKGQSRMSCCLNGSAAATDALVTVPETAHPEKQPEGLALFSPVDIGKFFHCYDSCPSFRASVKGKITGIGMASFKTHLVQQGFSPAEVAQKLLQLA